MKQVAKLRTLANSRQDRTNALPSDFSPIQRQQRKHTKASPPKSSNCARFKIRGLTARFCRKAQAPQELVVARQRVESLTAAMGLDYYGNGWKALRPGQLQVGS
ncbi:hypothetical protein KEM48_006124 [Puccinia striiformis f. sp. tritici PST-130]|nr:hypothetical protein H4Q26_006138 [Puccinia striiformis f. sp. tritici PST-130]KAI9614146.1 hypothetical protein KEM48_006124 [Puccinia striiformis f. sp. tritici PST-130]